MDLNIDIPCVDQEVAELAQKYQNLIESKAHNLYKEFLRNRLDQHVNKDMCRGKLLKAFYSCAIKYKDQGACAIVNAFYTAVQRVRIDIKRYAIRKVDRENGRTGKSGRKLWEPSDPKKFARWFFDTEGGHYVNTYGDLAKEYGVSRQTIAVYAKRVGLDRNHGDPKRERDMDVCDCLPSIGVSRFADFTSSTETT